jgi:hypothetical protein
MAKSKNKTQRVKQIVLIIFVIVGFILIIADLAGNISYELASDDELESAAQEIEDTPSPTLTEEERREMYSDPVGEEGE